jgi:hypothetical protein
MFLRYILVLFSLFLKIQKPLLRYETLQRLYTGILVRHLVITHRKGYELCYQLICRRVEFVFSV